MKNKIEIRQSKIKNAGRGVFATADIKKDEVIEICPIIILPEDNYPHIQQTMVMNYVFGYGESGDTTMLALGYGSLYNHIKAPNAKYELIEHEGLNEQNNELCITALKAIGKNEEIYINYGVEYDKMYNP